MDLIVWTLAAGATDLTAAENGETRFTAWRKC